MTTGLITSSYGLAYIVQINNCEYTAVTKAKATSYVVGDLVEVIIINSKQAQILRLLPRFNLIFRSDNYKSKMIASNIDQLLITIAAKPSFNPAFLNSALVCAEYSQIQPLIIINKCDLIESQNFIQQIKALYQEKLDYPILELVALDNTNSLKTYIADKKNLLIGQSGVGKSTITNRLYPEAQAKTLSITKKETSGKHTTTHANLYHIDTNTAIIDCPGLQEFGLMHLELANLAQYFPEFRPFLGACKFNNCRHLNEPGCKIIQALNQGLITELRYNFYAQLANKLINKKTY